MLFLLAATIALGAQAPTRADLSTAYLRFERALRAHPPEEAARVEIERAFDAATMLFFTGASERALQRIDEQTARLDPDHGDAERRADAYALDLSTREVVSATGGSIELRLRALRPTPGDRAAVVRVVMPTSGGRRVLATHAFRPPLAESNAAQIAVPGGGDYAATRIDLDVELEFEGARARRAGSIALVGRPLASIRADVLAALARVEPDGPPLEQALATCRARAALVDAEPSGVESARFLLDLAAHAADVEREAAEIVAGRDPYRRRAGTTWRVVRTEGGVELPLVVHAPAAACTDARVPLVVALHGAGGDEHMWLAAYGSGRMRELAERHGFVVACPRVGLRGIPPESFDEVVRALHWTHAIDPKRVHVVGHSYGANVAGSLRLARADAIASVALFAGAPDAGGDRRAPPMFLAAGAIDPIAAAATIARAGEAAREAGCDVELRVVEGRGHTLFVGDLLPDAIAWCLARRRP